MCAPNWELHRSARTQAACCQLVTTNPLVRSDQLHWCCKQSRTGTAAFWTIMERSSMGWDTCQQHGSERTSMTAQSRCHDIHKDDSLQPSVLVTIDDLVGGLSFSQTCCEDKCWSENCKRRRCRDLIDEAGQGSSSNNVVYGCIADQSRTVLYVVVLATQTTSHRMDSSSTWKIARRVVVVVVMRVDVPSARHLRIHSVDGLRPWTDKSRAPTIR